MLQNARPTEIMYFNILISELKRIWKSIIEIFLGLKSDLVYRISCSFLKKPIAV